MPAVHERDLTPGPGLTPAAGGWRVDAPHVRLTSTRTLPAGWYEVRLAAADQSATRKRVEVVFPAADRPVAREAFAWTRACSERFVLNLPRPATGVRVDVWDAAGTLSLGGFRVRKLPLASAVVRSARAKLHLLRTHRCLGPATARGAKLLLRGDWRRFGRKLLGGLADSRTMLPVTSDELRVTSDEYRITSLVTRHSSLVTVSADVRGLGGYDRVAVALLRHLPAHGLGLRLDPRATVRDDLLPAGRPPASTDGPRLVVGPPFRVPFFAPGSRDAVLTMWETDTLLPEWVATLNRAGLVIVPSRWQAECFRRDGVTVPVAVVPLGHEPSVYFPRCERPAVVTFGVAAALSAGGVRKNAQLAIDLFRRTFPDRPDVRLRVKITPGSPGLETFDDPRVEVLRALLPEAELADWYRSLTAFVSLSAGEGFGLHLLEAMACGVPLVAPRHGGPADFFDESVGWPVAYRPVRVETDIYRGTMIEPDADAVATTLRAVAADPGRRGEAAAGRAAALTWDATATGVAAAMREHGLLD